MKASEVLTEPPITIEPAASINEARKIMEHCRIRHLPVVQDQKVVGLVSDRDILITMGRRQRQACKPASAAGDEPALPDRVEQIMSAPPHCIGGEAYLDQVVEMMLEHKISALPVMADDGLLGVVTKTDLVGWYTDFCARNPAEPSTTALVGNCMRQQVITAQPGDAVGVVVDKMARADVQHMPIVEQSRVVGIVSDRDLRRLLGITVRRLDRTRPPPRPDEEGINAATIMTPDPKTARPDDRITDATAIMLAEKFSALPVLTGDGALAGIITVTDVIHLVRLLVAAAVAVAS